MTETEHLLEAVVETGVSGAVVLADGRGDRVEAAAGIADATTGEPLTPAHRFRIGSVTKIFVAPLVFRLVEEGLLDLDGDAAPFAEGITIRQLLNHTSGLDDFMGDPIAFFEPYRNDPDHRWELDARDELELVLQKPRLFQPGHGWAYHGSNYIVLPRQPILPGGPGLVDVTGIDVPFHRAGGGIVSTAGEVATLLRALLGGELLSEEMRTEMLDAVDSDWAETDRYGLGIGQITALMGRKRSACGPAWGHLGFSLGYVAIALSSEDSERQVVICANGQPTSEAAEGAFLDAAGELVWHLFCARQASDHPKG